VVGMMIIMIRMIYAVISLFLTFVATGNIQLCIGSILRCKHD